MVREFIYGPNPVTAHFFNSLFGRDLLTNQVDNMMSESGCYMFIHNERVCMAKTLERTLHNRLHYLAKIREWL